jgi:hypothetical protein
MVYSFVMLGTYIASTSVESVKKCLNGTVVVICGDTVLIERLVAFSKYSFSTFIQHFNTANTEYSRFISCMNLGWIKNK